MIAAGNVELAGIRVGGTIHAQQGLQVHGQLGLRRAEVTGEVDLADAALLNPGGTALDAWGMCAGQLSLLPERVEGTVDLRHASIQILCDDPSGSPTPLLLDGLRYSALEAPGTARSRLPWLSRDPAGYRPQPYEQLATLYRQPGHDAYARTVLGTTQNCPD
jgi:hypothetical protein